MRISDDGECRANSINSTTTDKSSQYEMLTSSNLFLCPRNFLRTNRVFFTIEYLSPATPPHPKLVDASKNYSCLAWGRRIKIKSYDSPWFFNKIYLQMSNAFVMAWDTQILFLFLTDTICSRALTKRSTKRWHLAAYVKYLTIFSRCLNCKWVASKRSLIRKHRFCFLFVGFLPPVFIVPLK